MVGLREAAQPQIFLLSEARGVSTNFQSTLSSSPEAGLVGEILHYYDANGRAPGEAWSLRHHLTVMPTLCDLERVVLKVHLSHLEKHDSSVAA